MRALGLAVLLASCTSSGKVPAPAVGQQPSIYFVAGAPGWTTKEAYKPRPDDPITSRTEPTLDWYSQHERFPDPSRSLAVRVSGHDLPMSQFEETLTGFSFRSRRVRGLQAHAGSAPGGPQVVLLPVAPGYTVMTLSYELTIDALVEWTDTLDAVDEAGWVAAGGVIAS